MKRGIRNFIILLAISQVAACVTDKALTQPVSVSSRDEAVAVLISVNTIAPWDQVADAVQPNFSLTGDQALQQIAPVTARIQEQVLSASGVSLGLGLSPGKPASAPQAPTSIPAGGLLPTSPSVSGDIGLDPILKYQAACALYQAVQLMNREVQYAAMRDGFVPYLVTMKFAIMPYRRDLPYDLHARISFFPGGGAAPQHPELMTSGGAAAGKPEATNADAPASTTQSQNAPSNVRLPQVLPMLVTDDIERALKSGAAEVARQIGLALSASIHGVGGGLDLNKVNESLKTISGQDINSRLTVTRLSDNTIYVRIGASNESTAELSLVGQTYNVSLLILVPREYFTDNNPKPQIQVVMSNELRHLDGTTLAGRPTATLVRQGDEAIRATLAGRYEDLLGKWNGLDDKTKEQNLRLLAGPIQTSRFSDFEARLHRIGFGSLNSDADYEKSLWTRLSIILADSSFETDYFELPQPSPILFAEQTPLLLDDSKDKSQVQLQAVSGVPATSKMMATLTLKESGTSKSYQLMAQTISLDASTGVLTLTFPSLAKSGIDKIKFGDIDLVMGQRCKSSDPSCPKICKPDSFKPLYTVVKAEATGTDATAKAKEDLITAEVTKIVPIKSVPYATVTIDPLKNDFAWVTVQGADVIKATDSSGVQLPISKGKVKVTQPTTIIFQLCSLSAGTQFTIQAEGSKNSKSTGKKAIQFIVIGR